VAIPGLAILAAIALHAPDHRSLAERGALSVTVAVGRALPLVGLAVAIGLAGCRTALAGSLFFALAACLGYAAKDAVTAALLATPGTSYRLFLVDPLACVTVGLVLAPPPRLRPWILPPLAAVCGAVIALSIKLNNPDSEKLGFPAGGSVAAIWLIFVLAMLARRLNGHWLHILARVLGSWLIAIGLLLGGTAFVQRSPVDTAPPLVQPTMPGIPEELPPKPRKLPGLGSPSAP